MVSLQLLGLLSLVTFLGSLIAVPWIINNMDADYFKNHWVQRAEKRRTHVVVATLILAGRSSIGALLFIAGVAMLFLPGQGVLTMLIGICVMEFPGKQRLLKKIIAQKKVQQGLNWIRQKGGKPRFEFSNSDV